MIPEILSYIFLPFHLKKDKFKSSYGRFKKGIYFWLHWVLVAAFRLSRVVVSGGWSLIVVQGLLTAVASLWNTASRAHRPHELWHVGSTVAAHRLQSVGLVIVVYGLSCPTCEISDQESYPCPLHWQADSFFFFFWTTQVYYTNGHRGVNTPSSEP